LLKVLLAKQVRREYAEAGQHHQRLQPTKARRAPKKRRSKT
jgi:hypothetical protein